MADYYPEGEGSMSDNATTATPENADPMAKEDNEDNSENTALVPNSFFGTDKEPEVGEICRVKIVHRYDDESEIQWLGPESEEESGESDSGSEMGKAMGDLTSRANGSSQAY